MTLGIARKLHPSEPHAVSGSSLRLSIHRALLSTRVRDKADTHGLSLFTVQHEVSGYSDIDDRMWTWGCPRPFSGLFRF